MAHDFEEGGQPIEVSPSINKDRYYYYYYIFIQETFVLKPEETDGLPGQVASNRTLVLVISDQIGGNIMA